MAKDDFAKFILRSRTALGVVVVGARTATEALELADQMAAAGRPNVTIQARPAGTIGRAILARLAKAEQAQGKSSYEE